MLDQHQIELFKEPEKLRPQLRATQSTLWALVYLTLAHACTLQLASELFLRSRSLVAACLCYDSGLPSALSSHSDARAGIKYLSHESLCERGSKDGNQSGLA